MPVPSSFANMKHVVFCYTSDLEKASKTLAKLLGGTYIRVHLKGTAVESISDYPPNGANAAWLVGHGLKTDTQIGTLNRASKIDIQALLDLLVGDGFSTVIDTCCQPDQRKVVAAKSKLAYYCATDGHDVSQIQDSSSLDSWWSANGMH
jgi:hypothetical protein